MLNMYVINFKSVCLVRLHRSGVHEVEHLSGGACHAALFSGELLLSLSAHNPLPKPAFVFLCHPIFMSLFLLLFSNIFCS